MLTPQDISEKRFVKAVFGGYDMPGVDDFLEEVSADYNTLYKENAILKSKLKVLVEKVEEYRSTEDAMRMALLTAQRMGEEITVEANRTKEELLKSASEEANAQLAEISKRVAQEEARLAAASKETTKFLEVSQAIIRKHTEFLKKLEAANPVIKTKTQSKAAAKSAPEPAPAAVQAPEPQPPAMPTPAPPPVAAPVAPPASAAPVAPVLQQPPAEPAPPVLQQPPAPPAQDFELDNIAQQIGNAVEKMTGTPAVVPAPENQITANDDPAPAFEKTGDTIELPVAEAETADITPRPKFDFDDLKFGANFDNDD